MQMIEKIGYSADKFIREHEKDGLRGIVEGRGLKEDAGRKYVTEIRVECTNTTPVKDVGIRDSPERARFFIPIH